MMAAPDPATPRDPDLDRNPPGNGSVEEVFVENRRARAVQQVGADAGTMKGEAGSASGAEAGDR